MNNSDLYILTFIVTGLWDVVLRIMAENWENLPKIVKTILPFLFNNVAPVMLVETSNPKIIHISNFILKVYSNSSRFLTGFATDAIAIKFLFSS